MADDGNGGGTSGGLHTHTLSGSVGSRSQRKHGRRSRSNGGGTELMADLLVEVFSNLPQRQLFEVMSVSRDWKKAIMESSRLWRKVKVGRKWHTRPQRSKGKKERRQEILLQLLKLAEVVRFTESTRYDTKQMMVVGGVLGANLRSLKLPGKSASPSFFPLLTANCPNLKSLDIERDLDDAITSLHISHPSLEKLKLNGFHFFTLIVDCPALLDLFFGVDHGVDEENRDAIRAPSLNCPRLTSLHLSDLHSPKGVLEAIASHAPDIERLRMHFDAENPLSTLTHFKALKDLKMYVKGMGLPANAFAQLPNLERLEVKGFEVSADLEIAHKGLRSLSIIDNNLCSSIVLDCPILEDLRLGGQEFDGSWGDTIETLCPLLKKIHLQWNVEEVEFEEDTDAFGIHEDRVEELVLQYLAQDVVLKCRKLERLVISWAAITEAPPTFPTVDCSNLTSLELDGYPFMLRFIPSVISEMPLLEVLKILCCREKVTQVVLEHARVCEVVIGNSRRMLEQECMVVDRVIIVGEFELTLMMPSLSRVEVKKSSLRVLKVGAREKGIVKYFIPNKGCEVIEMGPS